MESASLKGLASLTASLQHTGTDIPVAFQKNFFAALAHLCAAATESNPTSPGLHPNEETAENEYGERASSRYSSKLIREQLNLDEIVLNAAKELATSKNTDAPAHGKDLQEDWLNEFENLARLKSSQDMKLIFGRILAAEIKKPGTFSIKTMRVISQLEVEVINYFQRLCSQSVSLRSGEFILDARVVAFNGIATNNPVKQYGLSFENLSVLEEYGLILSEYNSWNDYGASIKHETNDLPFDFYFSDKPYSLIPTDTELFERNLKLNGIAFSKAGLQLLSIMPLVEVSSYRKALTNYLAARHLRMVDLGS